MQSLLRKFLVLLFSAIMILGLPNCSLLGLDEEEDDNQNLAALLLLAWAANLNSGCQNNSGLVICIPPGLRQ